MRFMRSRKAALLLVFDIALAVDVVPDLADCDAVADADTAD